MKQCPFCHEMIDEQETLCPYCGTVQDELSQPVSIEPNEGVQTDLLDENNEPTPSFTTKVETSIPEEDNNRSSQENRVKNNRLAYAGAWNKFKRFFTFFGERLVQPTNHYSRKRQYSRTYGYALIILATVMSAFVTTHLIHSLIGQYRHLNLTKLNKHTKLYLDVHSLHPLLRGVLPWIPKRIVWIETRLPKTSTRI